MKSPPGTGDFQNIKINIKIIIIISNNKQEHYLLNGETILIAVGRSATLANRPKHKTDLPRINYVGLHIFSRSGATINDSVICSLAYR